MSGYDNNQGGYGQQGGYGGYGGQQGGQQGGYGGQQGGGYGGQQGGGYGGQQGGGYGGQQGGYPPQGGPGYGQQGHQGGGGEASSYYQSGPQQGYGNQSHGGGPGGEDGERGLTGALAGGGAGAFAGNKFGGSKTATVVGGLIGAFAGHKGQDKVEDWRDDRKEKKEEEKHKEEEERRWEEERRRAEERRREEESRRRSRSRSRSSSRHRHSRRHSRSRSRSRSRSGHRYEAARSGAGAHYAGGFSATSRDIRLEAHGDYELRAECRTPSGDYRSSSIRLNEFLTNDRGSFRWVSGGGGGGGGESSYTVQQGDTLRNIASRYSHTSFDDIARHNNIANPDMIYPGQNLRIPGTGGGGGGCRGNFGASARDVRLVDGGRRLEAELRNGGDWVRSSIVLDERITNDNGRLHLI